MIRVNLDPEAHQGNAKQVVCLLKYIAHRAMTKKEELLKPTLKEGANSNTIATIDSTQVPNLTEMLKSLIFSSNLSGTKDQLIQVRGVKLQRKSDIGFYNRLSSHLFTG